MARPALLVAAFRFLATTDRQTAPPPTRLQQIGILALLLESTSERKRISVQEISDFLGQNRTTVQTIIGGLLACGLVARSVTVTTSGRGRAFFYHCDEELLLEAIPSSLFADADPFGGRS